MSVQAATLESISSSLKSLSIAATSVVSHAASTSPDSWKEAVSSLATGANFEYTKTLLFKPKTAKTAKAYPVLVVAKNDTETNMTALGKEINQKEMRLAAPELLQDFLGATKDDVSPLSVSKANGPEGSHPLLVVLDAFVASSEDQFAFHAASSEKTIFLTGKEVAKYLESTGAKVETIDFSKLASNPA